MEAVTDGENEGDDCDEVIYVGWGEPGGEWTQWGWRNEEGIWFQRWGDAYLKERLVICNDENTDGRARVTTDEEQVLPEDWTEIRPIAMVFRPFGKQHISADISRLYDNISSAVDVSGVVKHFT